MPIVRNRTFWRSIFHPIFPFTQVYRFTYISHCNRLDVASNQGGKNNVKIVLPFTGRDVSGNLVFEAENPTWNLWQFLKNLPNDLMSFAAFRVLLPFNHIWIERLWMPWCSTWGHWISLDIYTLRRNLDPHVPRKTPNLRTYLDV